MEPDGQGSESPLSVFILARSLDTGGSERQLVELAIGLDRRGHRARVGTFYSGGALAELLRPTGVEIVELNKSGRWDLLRFLSRTRSALRTLKPDVVYSFLGGANIVAGLLKPFLGRTRLVWSVRNSEFDASVDHWVTRFGYRLETRLAVLPDAIIANSSAGRAFALSRGFPDAKISVVPNGIDTERFRPDPELRRSHRAMLGLGDGQIAIGVVGRLNKTKDYPNFLRAARLVSERQPDARFLCVGGGDELQRLEQIAVELGIAERVHFTGEMDAAAAFNAFDIACSPSITEGFSNVIAEAMSCGLPCVVTDVGDSAAIVGDMGSVVPPSNPEALAGAIDRQIENLSVHDASAARRRIVENFSVGAMVERTIAVFRAVAAA